MFTNDAVARQSNKLRIPILQQLIKYLSIWHAGDVYSIYQSIEFPTHYRS